MKLKTLLITGLAVATLCNPFNLCQLYAASGNVPVIATEENVTDNLKYLTAFDVDKINLYNDLEQENLIVVEDEDSNLLFTAMPVSEWVYTKVCLNVRTIPCIYSVPLTVLAENSQVHRVGRGSAGWDIIQVNNVNYFMWSDFLTTEKPAEEDVIEVLEVKPSQPGVYSTKSAETEVSSSSYLGSYQLTAYCNCSKCCGKWAGGNTASGTTPTAGRTVACNSIPFGTKLLINGHTYTVEDTGNMADNVIDIYFNSHEAALQFGRQYAEVYKIN